MLMESVRPSTQGRTGQACGSWDVGERGVSVNSSSPKGRHKAKKEISWGNQLMMLGHI